MKSLTLAIPFMNQLDAVKGIMGNLKYMTSPTTNWLIIDNGSTDPIEDFFRQTLRPKRLDYLKNTNNLGMVATYNQIFDSVETDLVAVLHNDVLIYEPNWDRRVIHTFKTLPNLGMLGFFGASGVGAIGERIQDNQFEGQMSGISNMLEAEVHGIRMVDDFVPIAILDGFAMVFNMKMIRQAGGLDPRYKYHHLYDRDLPLTSLNLGFNNVVLNVPCHHQSGTTANNAEYQQWINKKTKKKDAGDDWTHRENSKLFQEKWHQILPLYVEKDFSLRSGRDGLGRHFKGDDIRTFTPKAKK